MKIKDTVGWELSRKNNTDPYGARIVEYAEKWADLMEAEIERGVSIADCAKATGRIADYDGITGFMYGAAVSMLSWGWEHGEALRVWHNAQFGVGAHEKGTVNPAILRVSVPA